MGALGAIVAAAGVSSRMGEFKPLMMIDGKTMIGRVTDTLQAAGAGPVVVVDGYRAQELEESLAGRGILFVRNDRYYETAMFDSLVLGASALPPETERILFTPADIPLVQVSTIEALLEAEGDFIRPRFCGRTGHPALVSRALLSRLATYTGDGGMRQALAACAVTPAELDVPDEGVLLEADTREEYCTLLHCCRERTGRALPLQLQLRVCLQEESVFWGPECMQLLELVQASGSIHRACACLHMSYSRGWQMIRKAEEELGFSLLIRKRGGITRGGSVLTEKGAGFLETCRRMDREIRDLGKAVFQRYFPQGRVCL